MLVASELVYYKGTLEIMVPLAGQKEEKIIGDLVKAL